MLLKYREVRHRKIDCFLLIIMIQYTIVDGIEILMKTMLIAESYMAVKAIPLCIGQRTGVAVLILRHIHIPFFFHSFFLGLSTLLA